MRSQVNCHLCIPLVDLKLLDQQILLAERILDSVYRKERRKRKFIRIYCSTIALCLTLCLNRFFFIIFFHVQFQCQFSRSVNILYVYYILCIHIQQKYLQHSIYCIFYSLLFLDFSFWSISMIRNQNLLGEWYMVGKALPDHWCDTFIFKWTVLWHKNSNVNLNVCNIIHLMSQASMTYLSMQVNTILDSIDQFISQWLNELNYWLIEFLWIISPPFRTFSFSSYQGRFDEEVD